MRKLSSQKSGLPLKHKQTLQEVLFTDCKPGAILRDFEALLDYLGGGVLPIAGPHQLPLRTLPEINARLSHPLEIDLRRPLQKSYPHINGLYLLLRSSGLTSIGGTGKKLLLGLDGETWESWNSLNPTERYGTLLESWLLRGNPEIIGERSRMILTPDHFQRWMYFFRSIPEKGLPVAGNKEALDSLRYTPGWYNLGLLELFGLVSVQHGRPAKGQGWNIESVRRTAFGDALLALLQGEFFNVMNLILAGENKGQASFGVLQPVLQPYFTDWKNNLSVPEWVFREGTHIFKVSLGRVRYRIAAPENSTLDDLADAILNAIDFDHDHLYEFSYENRFGGMDRFNHPAMDEGPWTSETLIGDVPLRIGQTMTYLYDFGDNWEFDVTLEGIEPAGVAGRPVLLDIAGAPPEQYPRWDEDE